MALAALSRARLVASSSLSLFQVRHCSSLSPASSSSGPASQQPCKYAATCTHKTSRCPAALALQTALTETGVMTPSEAGKRVDGTTVFVVLAGLSTLVLLWTSPAEMHEAFEKPPRAAFRSRDYAFPPFLALPSRSLHPLNASTTPEPSWDEKLMRVPGVEGVVKVLGALQPASPTIGVFKEWQAHAAGQVASQRSV